MGKLWGTYLDLYSNRKKWIYGRLIFCYGCLSIQLKYLKVYIDENEKMAIAEKGKQISLLSTN